MATSEEADRPLKDIALGVKTRITEDHTLLASAGVAFFGFLAVIPALAALVSLAGLLLTPDEAAERVEDLFGSAPEEVQDLLSKQLESIAGGSGGALSTGIVIGLVLSLWSASSGMGHLVDGVNLAYGEVDDRKFFVKKLRALAFTLGAIGFLVFAVVGLAVLPELLEGADLPRWSRTLFQFLFWPVLIAGFGVALAMLYRFGPDRPDAEWRWVSWGSAVAIVVWILASVAFKVYAANFGSYGESYGTLAAVVVLLLWLLISAFSVLLGAHVNAEIELQVVQRAER